MKKNTATAKKNSLEVVTINYLLTPLGETSSISLETRIIAQVQLSRNNRDIILAQKATDLVLGEAGEDIDMYILVVLMNEVEILTSSFVAKDSFDERESSNLFVNFQRIKKLIIKYHPLFKDVFISHVNVFDKLLSSLTCVYVKTCLDLDYNSDHQFKSKSDDISPLRDIISDISLLKDIENAIWENLSQDAWNLLLSDVFWEIIYHRKQYNIPIEPETDPDLIFKEVISNLSIDFLCNPLYVNEEVYKKAKNDIWAFSCLYNATELFHAKERSYDSDEIISAERKITDHLKILFNKLRDGLIKESQIIVSIKKIILKNLSVN